MKRFLLAACATFLGMTATMGESARAEFVLNLNSHISGATPADPTPWVTLDFKDVSSGLVQLTITNNLSSAEYVHVALFNSSIALNAGDFTYVSGQAVSGITFNDDGGSQIKAGVFGVDFAYPTSGSGGVRLSGGLNSVYDIQATGLTAQSFDVFSTAESGGVGTYLGATEVRGIPVGASGSIGTTVASVPEPSTMILGILGLLGVVAGRKLGRQGRA